jgi:hypothetical protein
MVEKLYNTKFIVANDRISSSDISFLQKFHVDCEHIYQNIPHLEHQPSF